MDRFAPITVIRSTTVQFVSMLTYFSDPKHRSGCGFSMMRGYLRMRGVEIVPFFFNIGN